MFLPYWLEVEPGSGVPTALVNFLGDFIPDVLSPFLSLPATEKEKFEPFNNTTVCVYFDIIVES